MAEHDPLSPLVAHVVLASVLRIFAAAGGVVNDLPIARRPATALGLGDQREVLPLPSGRVHLVAQLDQTDACPGCEQLLGDLEETGEQVAHAVALDWVLWRHVSVVELAVLTDVGDVDRIPHQTIDRAWRVMLRQVTPINDQVETWQRLDVYLDHLLTDRHPAPDDALAIGRVEDRRLR
jgi:hypothetical protein